MINNSLFVLLLKFFVYPSSANLQPWLFPLVCMVQKTYFRTIIFTSAFFGKVQYPPELSRKLCNSAEEAGLFHSWRKTEVISIMYSWLSISSKSRTFWYLEQMSWSLGKQIRQAKQLLGILNSQYLEQFLTPLRV